MNFKKTTYLCCLVMLLSLFSFPEPAKPQESKWDLGGSIQEKRAAALLQTIEKADEESVRRFIDEHAAPDLRDSAPLESQIARFQRIKQASAGMQITAVEKSGPNAMAITLKLNTGRLVRIDVETEAQPPHRVIGFSRRAAAAAAAPSPGSELKFASFEELDGHLSRMAAEDRFSGVVLVGQGNQTVFQKAYGMADRENRTPNRPDTLFDLGSLNKMFTSVVILRLAQEGKINLDDRLGKYLTGFPPEIADKVTIRLLLQMRAGFGDFFGHPKFTGNVERFRKVDDYMEIARTTPLKFEPGTGQAYSNLGYVVLGAIIEAVTKRSYYDVVQDYVYQPAGMTSTGSFERGKVKNAAISYTRMMPGETTPSNPSAPLRSSVSSFPPVGSPAGGGFSTAEDLKRFSDALLADRLLKEEYTHLFLSRYEPVKETKPVRSFALAGGSQGVSTAVFSNAALGQTVIVLANLDRPLASTLGKDINAAAAQLNKNSAAKSEKP